MSLNERFFIQKYSYTARQKIREQVKTPFLKAADYSCFHYIYFFFYFSISNNIHTSSMFYCFTWFVMLFLAYSFDFEISRLGTALLSTRFPARRHFTPLILRARMWHLHSAASTQEMADSSKFLPLPLLLNFAYLLGMCAVHRVTLPFFSFFLFGAGRGEGL